MDVTSEHFETRAIHAGQDPDAPYGAVSVPIYQNSTYAQDDVAAPKVWDYGRAGNPTWRGLEAAIGDLLSPLEADGVATHLDVQDGVPSARDPLVYRVVRESLRNVQAHAAAHNVWVRLQHEEGTMRVCVEDDGRGFEAAERERRAGEGHVGLRLLEGVVRQARGTLDVRSRPGRGTTVELEVPA